MRKLIFGIIFAAVGSGFYWMVSRTTSFSIQKWDARFETILRGTLNATGFKNEDILSSLNVIKKDKDGEWVTKQITLRIKSSEKIKEIKNELERSGADVTESVQDGFQTLVVKRGSRIYQEIRFKK